MNCDLDIIRARQQSRQRVNDAAMDVHAWIQLQVAIANAEIRRKAEFPARSAGQRRRFAAIKQGGNHK